MAIQDTCPNNGVKGLEIDNDKFSKHLEDFSLRALDQFIEHIKY